MASTREIREALENSAGEDLDTLILQRFSAEKVQRDTNDMMKEKKKRRLEELKDITAHNVSPTPVLASTVDRDISRQSKMEALKKRKEELLAKQKDIEEGKISFTQTSGTAARIAGYEAERSRYQKELNELPTAEQLLEERSTAARVLHGIERGIDVCFFMDCTGSMGCFITAVKDKILEIITAVERLDTTAILRLAFVGYRDHHDKKSRLERVDFVGRDQLAVVREKLATCKAKGGEDGPEDIAGGLKAVTELAWNSSTRLIIHFGDAPCHGKQYHDLEDEYGDPNGLIIADLLHEVIKKRIDYHFMKITKQTDKMIGIFQQVFKAAGKEIYINPVDANAADFVPKTINSISSSMARSAAQRGNLPTSPIFGGGVY